MTGVFGWPIRAVLFDIDDTLVDLRTAMEIAVRAVSAEYLPELSEPQWQEVHREFREDRGGHYEAFLRGEIGFIEQRIARARRALAVAGGALPVERAESWNACYEVEAQRNWRAYPDVVTALDELDAVGVVYGAVSNNVEAYQRRKLDLAGLSRISVLIGTDTVGVPKPDPAIFHEGVRELGFSAAETLYVGDNLLIDAVGASEAGLAALWLNREDRSPELPGGRRWEGAQLSGLAGLSTLL
ncbi:HAD family hydrolase [Psychromicrobium sp. YIM B11713]|uniref:HAD family hydrolase n=1 Tax=Psychromicrobium sp. YIM B11713 TaxID=3145233 RepID=UPI00374E67AE